MAGRRTERAEAVIQILGEDGFSSLTEKIEKEFAKIAAKAAHAAGSTDKVTEALKKTKKEAQGLERLEFEFGEDLFDIFPRVTKAIRGVKAESRALVAEWDKSLPKAWRKVGADAETSLGRMKAQWNAVTGAIQGAIAAAQAVDATITATIGMMKQAGVDEAVEQQFNRSFERATETLERFDQAAADTLSEGKLRRMSLPLEQAGLAAGEIERLFDLSARIAASGVGAAKGITTTADAMELLTDSIIGASDSDLEKLGIIFDMPGAADALAKELNEVKDKGLESKAVLDHIFRELPKRLKNVDPTKGIGAQAQRAEAAWEDFKTSLVRGAGEVIHVWQRWDELGNELADSHERMAEGIEVEAVAAFRAGEAAARSWQIAMQRGADQVSPRIDVLTGELRKQRDGVVSLGEAWSTLRKGFVDAAKDVRDFNREQKELQRLADLWTEAGDRWTDFADAIKDAELAEEMGLNVIATEKWNEALEAAERLQIDLTAQVPLLSKALKSQRNELGQTLLTMALMEEAAGNHGKAAALRAQAADLATGGDGTGSTKPDKDKKPRGRGGRGKKKKDFDDLSPDEQLADIRKRQNAKVSPEFLRNKEARKALGDEVFERYQRIAREAREAQAEIDEIIRRSDEHSAMMDEQIKQTVAQREKHKEIMASLAAEGVGSFNDATQALQAFGDQYGTIVGQIGAGAEVIYGEFGRISQRLKEFEAAGKTSGEAWEASAAGMATATGQFAASFIEDEGAKALVMHFAEAAAAISSFAAMDIQGGVMHSLASAMWGVAAGVAFSKGGGGGGGGRASARSGGVGARPPSFQDVSDRRAQGGESQGATINITVQGNVMSSVQMERSVERALANSRRRRGKQSGDFMGPQ